MNTIKITTFDKLKVGEVFATDGCWNVFCKVSRDKMILLADDHSEYPCTKPGDLTDCVGWGEIHSLPKSVQDHWKTKPLHKSKEDVRTG